MYVAVRFCWWRNPEYLEKTVTCHKLRTKFITCKSGDVVIVWWLNLQLPVQSVPITAKVVSSNPVHGEVYSMQHKVFQ